MKTIKELLRTAQLLNNDEGKPKRGSDFPEKPKPVDPDVIRVWDEIQKMAFNLMVSKVQEWEKEHLIHHYLSLNIVAANRAIKDLVDIYSNEYVSDFVGIVAEKRHQSLLIILNRSLHSSSMFPTEKFLQTALNMHPSQQIARRLDRDQLKAAFIYQVRHGIVQVAVGRIDDAFRTSFASQLILDPEKAAEPAPKRGPIWKRS